MAGCAAAIAAAREGASVLLIEQYSYLGGNATRAMVQPWQSFHASRFQPDGSLPPQVIGGIAQEFVADLITLGASPSHIVDPIGFAGSITPIDTELLKLYLPHKLETCGVGIKLNTSLLPEHMQNARQIVDASGCAAAARILGAPVIQPAAPQPMSWLFTMSGIDTQAVRDYQLLHPAEFVLHPGFTSLRADYIAVSGYFNRVRVARQRGDWTIPRDRLLMFSTPRPGEVLINTTRIPADHPTPRIEGLRQVYELLSWLPRNIPGFESARLARLADDIGERESYRLAGRTQLSAKEIRTGAVSLEAVARGCYPVDIHSAASEELVTDSVGGPGWYDIPLGCLEHPSHAQLLVAGRCISADRQGFASARVLPTAMATGQAAGMIAASRALEREFDISACLSAVSLV